MRKRKSPIGLPRIHTTQETQSSLGRGALIIAVSIILIAFVIWLIRFAASRLPHSEFLTEDIHKIMIIVVALFVGVIVFGLFRSTARLSKGHSVVSGLGAFVLIFAGTFIKPSETETSVEVRGSVQTRTGLPVQGAELWVAGHQTQPVPARTDTVGNFVFRVFDVVGQEKFDIAVRAKSGGPVLSKSVSVAKVVNTVIEVPDSDIQDALGNTGDAPQIEDSRQAFRLRFSRFAASLDAENEQRILRGYGIETVIEERNEHPRFVLISRATFSYAEAMKAQEEFRRWHSIQATIVPVE